MRPDVPPRPDTPHARPAARPDRPTGRSTWRWWEGIAVYLLATLVSSAVTMPLLGLVEPEGVATLVASAAIAVVNVAIVLLWLSRFHPGWLAAIGWPRRIWPEIRSGLGFGAMLYPGIVFGVGLLVTLLLSALSGKSVEPPEQIPERLTGFGVATSIVYALVVAPIHEELFFRGVLHRSLADRYGFVAGALGSGVAFGLIHYIPGPWYDSALLMAVMVVTGFALAYVYERRGNLLASIVAHSTFNAIGLALIYGLR